MLSLFGPGTRLGDGLSRRQVLQVGSIGFAGLSLPRLLAADGSDPSKPRGKARSCILLFLMGGPPQHSTWDPKPDAPAEVRGEIGSLATTIPGVRFGELMPQLAARADQLCILRAVSTGDNAHSSSGYYMLTGRPHSPPNRENANPGFPNNWPNVGAVTSALLPSHSSLPAAIRLPCHIFNTDGSVWPGQDAGFLGRGVDPWLFRGTPASPDFTIPEVSLPLDVTSERLAVRRSLLDELNDRFSRAERSGLHGIRRLDHYQSQRRRAFELLASDHARTAFDLNREPDGVRDRYSRTQFGQSVLLARRLIEAGVRLVQVNWYRGPDEPAEAPCWDSHANETQRLKTVLIPPLDAAFSALIADLSQRGLLDETLVLCLAEFGRTPRFNARAGRDHWGHVFSVALAGGGIRGGAVFGASDRLGAYPQDGLVKPEDITATLFHCLGLAPDDQIHDAQGRPLAISSGRVLEQVLS
jgi:hypothetical protein